MTTVTLPATQEEFEEALNDKAQMRTVWEAGPDGWGDFCRGYAKKVMESSAGEHLAVQMREQAQLGIQEFMQDQARAGARAPQGFKPGMELALAQGRGPRRARAVARAQSRFRNVNVEELFDAQGLFSPTAAGAAKDIDNASYSDSLTKFIWAAIKGEHVARRDGNSALMDELTAFKGALAKALEIKNASMSERVPAEGGFLVPETLRSEVLALSLEDSVMRQVSTVIPMDSLRVPIPSIDDTSHTSSVFGGVAAYWSAEGASLKASAPAFSRVLLEASKLTAFTQIPNELLQDSATPMDVWFRTFFPKAIAFFEDLAFLTGDGVNQPEGVLNCPGAVTIDPAASATIQFIDLAKMLARLWPPSLKNSMWVASNDALEQLLQLAVTSNSTTIAPPGWLQAMQAIDAPGGSTGDGVTYRLFGRPLRITEKVPYPGSGKDGSISLIDPTYYLIGDRQTMQIASSAEFAFDKDEVSYRITERLDGRGWLRTPLTPANGSSNTLSPFVKCGDTHS